MADPVTIAGIVVPAVLTLAKPVVALLWQKYQAGKNSLSLDDVHAVLNMGSDKLLAVRRDKETEVSRHIEEKDPSEVYKIWKRHVSKIAKEVVSLNTEYEKVKGQNERLREKIESTLGDVIACLEECPEKFLVDKLPVERVINELRVPPIKEYDTLHNAFQNIMAQLQRNNGVKCVALCGQRGVGKTTIMRYLNNDENVDKEFDMVIFIKVAADEQTDHPILHKIADRIKVDRESSDIDDVVKRIQNVLENKRYLLILDGLTHTLDGIWETLGVSNDKKDSKVVIASHYRRAVISNCVDKAFELKKLPETEARKMFLNIVGKYLEKDKAIQVCDRFCHFLPLLIDPIARCFKYQPVPSTGWQLALNQWMWWPQADVKGIKEVYSNLEICYKRLGDQSRQQCFLYAALYPANSKIHTHYFVECCIVQGLLQITDATPKYSGMRTSAIDGTLRHLVDVAFLEEGEGEKMRYVKMNNLFRQLALHISSNDSKFKTYVDDEEAITSASCQSPIWLSMVGSEKGLPENQDYSSLQTLLLQKNKALTEISRSMRNLLVLNLYGTQIKKLSSLSKSTKLKALYLNGCSCLRINVRQIKSLKGLQVLDIRGTGIDSVPFLRSLWCLRMSYIGKGDYSGISKLDKLEELTIEIEDQFRQKWDDAAAEQIKNYASSKNVTFRPKFKSSCSSRGS